MRNPVPTLTIPVENQVREFDAKLLLGCIAAERGFSVVLGSRTFVHFEADSIPRGVYLAKSMRSLSERMFSILRALGHEIVAFDEEGLVRPSDARYYARRMSPAALRHVSALLAWGPDNAAVFERFPACGDIPIHVTGNPRIDMLRPEVRPFYAEQVRRIRERLGRFILLNSNFGLLNHFVPGMRSGVKDDGPIDEFISTLTAHRRAMFEHFRRALPGLCRAFPDYTIVLRPHPVESHEPWLKLAGDHPNLVVEDDGSVVPWLMACDVLVQNGCQTAIEGSLLGTPVVSFRPVTHELDVEFIENLSHQAVDIDALVAVVRSILARKLGAHDHPDREGDLGRHIAAREGPLASERIIDVLEQAGYLDNPPPKTSVRRRLHGWMHNRLRTALKMRKLRKMKHRNSQDYHDHRFPELSLDDVRERVARIGEQLGRFKDLRVRRRSRHVFEIDA